MRAATADTIMPACSLELSFLAIFDLMAWPMSCASNSVRFMTPRVPFSGLILNYINIAIKSEEVTRAFGTLRASFASMT